MSEPRTCPITGKSLEGFHGNRKIHQEAEKKRKQQTNKMRNDKIKEINKLAIRLDKILEYHFPFSNGKVELDRKILNGFVWDFLTKMTKSEPPIFWIIDYGYRFNKNKDKITIHNGNTI